MSHESTTDKQTDNVVPIHKEQQLNRSNVPKASPDAWVAISKRQSPTKVSNSSAPSQMSKNYGSTGVPTSHGHQGKSIPFRSNGSSSSILTTFPSSSSTKFATTNRKQQPSTDETSSTNNVLILIQTKKNIQLHSVRDQFQQFTDMFGITLANITIDFDAIDGKWIDFVASFTYNVCNLTSITCVCVSIQLPHSETVGTPSTLSLARHAFILQKCVISSYKILNVYGNFNFVM